MNQQEWEEAAEWYQKIAEARRAQEAKRRPGWWGIIGVIMLVASVALLGYETAQFNPWQFGILVGLVTATIGAWMVTSYLEGRRSGGRGTQTL